MLSDDDKQRVHRCLYRLGCGSRLAFVSFFMMPNEEQDYLISLIRDVRKEVVRQLKETNSCKQE